MRIDGSQARAARATARREPIEYAIGGEVFEFRPEMALDVLFGVDAWAATSIQAMRLWMLAHMVLDAKCDTSCVDGETPTLCDALSVMKGRLRAVKVDGEPLDELDMDEMFRAVRRAQGLGEVDEGESSSSADSSETAGDDSSETSTPPTPQTSFDPAPAASDG